MIELETIPTDDLVDEVLRRFDHFICCGVKQVEGETDFTFRQFNGDTLKCLGLVQWMNRKLLERYARNGTPVADDEGTEIDAD